MIRYDDVVMRCVTFPLPYLSTARLVGNRNHVLISLEMTRRMELAADLVIFPVFAVHFVHVSIGDKHNDQSTLFDAVKMLLYGLQRRWRVIQGYTLKCWSRIRYRMYARGSLGVSHNRIMRQNKQYRLFCSLIIVFC